MGFAPVKRMWEFPLCFLSVVAAVRKKSSVSQSSHLLKNREACSTLLSEWLSIVNKGLQLHVHRLRVSSRIRKDDALSSTVEHVVATYPLDARGPLSMFVSSTSGQLLVADRTSHWRRGWRRLSRGTSLAAAPWYGLWKESPIERGGHVCGTGGSRVRQREIMSL